MLTNSEEQKISKFLSLVLRHKPEEIGITLNEQGWTDVQMLLSKLALHKMAINIDDLESIVENNNKKRFAFDETHTRIRASQGHSTEVDLGYAVKQPPILLYHGTATRFLDSILLEGLQKRNRLHVHLSADESTANNVGSRHGKPIILTILAGEMATKGYSFYQSDNGVWLTDSVPVEFIDYESPKSK